MPNLLFSHGVKIPFYEITVDGVVHYIARDSIAGDLFKQCTGVLRLAEGINVSLLSRFATNVVQLAAAHTPDVCEGGFPKGTIVAQLFSNTSISPKIANCVSAQLDSLVRTACIVDMTFLSIPAMILFIILSMMIITALRTCMPQQAASLFAGFAQFFNSTKAGSSSTVVIEELNNVLDSASVAGYREIADGNNTDEEQQGFSIVP